MVQSGKPNKLVYTLTPEGRAALRHWAARPSVPASIKDDLLVRLYALDSVDVEPLRTDLMARLEHHRDRFARYERLLKPATADMHIDAYAPMCIKSEMKVERRRLMALGDAILACLTEHPMTGYELAKTFDSSIGFFWKADHQADLSRAVAAARAAAISRAARWCRSGEAQRSWFTPSPPRAGPR